MAKDIKWDDSEKIKCVFRNDIFYDNKRSVGVIKQL